MRTLFFICVVTFFLYFLIGGCTNPAEIPAVPEHYTFVPEVENLQAVTNWVNIAGKDTLMVTLTWKFDTTNTNIRSWDIERAIADTSQDKYYVRGNVLKPAVGYPMFVDKSSDLQFITVPSPDSLDVYYRLKPNGLIRSFIGKPSDVLHVVVYKNK